MTDRISALKATEAYQIDSLVRDHNKAELARIIVAGRVANAERDAVQHDLYQALKGLLSAIEYVRAVRGPSGDALRRRAHAALDKARGQ